MEDGKEVVVRLNEPERKTKRKTKRKREKLPPVPEESAPPKEVDPLTGEQVNQDSGGINDSQPMYDLQGEVWEVNQDSGGINNSQPMYDLQGEVWEVNQDSGDINNSQPMEGGEGMDLDNVHFSQMSYPTTPQANPGTPKISPGTPEIDPGTPTGEQGVENEAPSPEVLSPERLVGILESQPLDLEEGGMGDNFIVDEEPQAAEPQVEEPQAPARPDDENEDGTKKWCKVPGPVYAPERYHGPFYNNVKPTTQFVVRFIVHHYGDE